MNIQLVKFTDSIIVSMKNYKRALKSTETPQKILSGRRIPIPEGFMKKYSIREGDFVVLKEESGKLSILPAEVKIKK